MMTERVGGYKLLEIWKRFQKLMDCWTETIK